MPVPTYDGLFNPLLLAMRELGGSASVSEQEDKVAELIGLSDEEAAEIHRGNRTKLSYRLAWARNYLKRAGLLDNSARGVWALTAKGKASDSVDPKTINRLVKSFDADAETSGIERRDKDESPPELRWEDEALETIKQISPKAFETLCQRLLRESGFIQVEIIGRSGDGGIDGRSPNCWLSQRSMSVGRKSRSGKVRAASHVRVMRSIKWRLLANVLPAPLSVGK
jgi:restriction system protein